MATGWNNGIIPACAGSTRAMRSVLLFFRDHPRMCGEHFRRVFVASTLQGSSPHVRGARRLIRVKCSTQGIIPACAGSTPMRVPALSTSRDHPRMCGEHFPHPRLSFRREGSSPRIGARASDPPDFFTWSVISTQTTRTNN